MKRLLLDEAIGRETDRDDAGRKATNQGDDPGR